MNDRIEQLVESIISDPSLNEEWPEFYESFRRDGALYLHVFAEKFAEAIMHQCCLIGEENGGLTTEDFQDLKKDFGVTPDVQG